MISQDEIYRIYREYYTDNMGSVSAEDVGYLQKIINEIRPSDVLEIGTASGMSTGFIARFMAEHGGGALRSIDISTHYYADREKPVGYLADRIYVGDEVQIDLINPQDSTYTIERFAPQTFSLIFIDANHRHPWPTLDTIAVLPLLADGGVLIHHDYNLFRMGYPEFICGIGPKYLYDQLPPDWREMSNRCPNIFSIRPRGDYQNLAPRLAESLFIPWTISTKIGSEFLKKLYSIAAEHLGDELCVALEESALRYNKPVAVQPSFTTDRSEVSEDHAITDDDREDASNECETEEVPLGMISLAERRFYEDTVRDLSGMEGAIVDLGCWMGASAIALARGLSDTDLTSGEELFADTRRILAYDRFIWQDWMNVFLEKVSGDYTDGDSFLPEARDRLGKYADRIELIPVDLERYVWQGWKIKLLVVDAMKSWRLCHMLAKTFYPFLTAGSILVHQDFKYYSPAWIHVLQYRLRKWFRPYRDVPDGWTVAFEAKSSVPVAEARKASLFADICDKEVDDAFAYCCGLVEGKGLTGVAAAHVMFFAHTEKTRQAETLLAHYRNLDLPDFKTIFDPVFTKVRGLKEREV